MSLNVFVSCAPGLETLLSAEIRGLIPVGFLPSPPADIEVAPGGVSFVGQVETLAHALVGLGLASRVLLRVKEFPVRHLNELETTIAELDWLAWLWPNQPFRVRSTAKKSKLYHTGAIDERVHRGVKRSLGIGKSDSVLPVSHGPVAPLTTAEQSPTPEWPEIVVRIERDQCTVSLDVSGTPLHRRGYRRNPYRAPLREDLARALVVSSGWQGQLPLWDPFCGSGTILMEAAIWAAAYPPGLLRSYALEQTRLADAQTMEQIKRERWSWRSYLQPLAATSADGPGIFLFAADADAKAVAAAQQNWAAWPWAGPPAAGPDSGAHSLVGPERRRPEITWCVADLRQLPMPTAPIAIVTNPPWGGRIHSGRDLLPLYQKLGAWRKQAGPTAKLALVAHDRELAYRTGVPLHSAFLTDSGGLKINALIE